jgi:hypothetical protein
MMADWGYFEREDLEKYWVVNEETVARFKKFFQGMTRPLATFHVVICLLTGIMMS